LKLPDLLKVDDAAPLLLAIAGPNGAGKSTFYQAHLRYTGLPFVNADAIAKETSLSPYESAAVAESIRRGRFALRESFIFETVFSDPVGEKIAFLEEAAAAGYNVVLFFIGISGVEMSLNRVGMRVLEGGHGVPVDKLEGRYPRTMENLRLALLRLPKVLVYDNDDLREPYRLVAVTGSGVVLHVARPVPRWLRPLLPKR
jgi:predicted ABC-type ATPase